MNSNHNYKILLMITKHFNLNVNKLFHNFNNKCIQLLMIGDQILIK